MVYVIRSPDVRMDDDGRLDSKLVNGGQVGRVGRDEKLTRVDMFDPSNPSLQYKALNHKGRKGRNCKLLEQN